MSNIYLIVPEAAFQAASDKFGVDKKLDPFTFEGKTAFKPNKKTEISSSIRKAGIPACVIAFNNANSSIIMWRDRVVFDAVGQVVDRSVATWQFHADLQYVVESKLRFLFKGERIVLDQLVMCFTCPEFCPNQIEYGKRYALSQMLLD